MNVLVFGATGTAGTGVLQACLGAADVSDVRVIVRRPLGFSRARLRVLVHEDFLNYETVRDAFTGVDACLYALGISVRQAADEAQYRHITRDFAVAAAAQLGSASPAAILHFVSGEGTALDSRYMWARVKAETERELATITDTVCWRPGFIDGGSAATGPRLYRALRPGFRLLRSFRGLYVTSEDIGRAMLQATRENVRSGVIGNAGIRDLADRGR